MQFQVKQLLYCWERGRLVRTEREARMKYFHVVIETPKLFRASGAVWTRRLRSQQ